jgi:hypothetical protein
MADEARVLKDAALLHDRQSRRDHGSKDHEPQDHRSCIGRHEERR